MSQDTKETKQEKLLSNLDPAVDYTFKIVMSVIQAKGQTFQLNSRAVQDMLGTVYTQVTGFMNMACGDASPAISIESSVSDDYIICLEDGVKVKMLKKYLKSRYNMTTDQYARKWNLPKGYPFVAPNYSKRRQMLAIQTKLGHGARRTPRVKKTG